MARGRPHGRSKCDHRVCQEGRHARAAEYRERIAISAEQQEARIAAVNAECIVEDAPRRRRGQKSRQSKTRAGAARITTGGRACKESGSGKKKAKKGLERSLGKAAGRDLHSLHCSACGATAEFGLRGSKEGGTIKYSCEAHAAPSGCFRIDRDRAAWAADQELRRLRAKLRRLEQELRDLGGAAEDAPSAPASADAPSAPASAAGQESGSTRNWVSVPKSGSLIAMLLLRGGVESNPGPTLQEEKEQALKKSWHDFDSDIDPNLLDYLAKEQLSLARWRGATSKGSGSQTLGDLKANYPGRWLAGWTGILENAAATSTGQPGPSAAGTVAPRRLSDSEVLSQLQDEYQAPVMAHIQDLSSSLSRRQEPIMPDANGVVEELGPCLNLEGYAVFALRALIALLVLQSRSNKVKSGDSNRENQDDKFACGTQILRIVGAPGTGKTTALTFLWRYIYDHLDELLAKLPGCDNLKISHLRERIQNSLRLDLFLCFTFSNAGLEQLLREEGPAMTGAFMATRMLYAMVGEAGWTYQTFLQQMDPALRLSLEPRHLMQFIQSAAGLGQKRGLVVFNFDECGAPKPEAPGQPTYFQRGLSDLVPWRWEEAVRRFKDGAEARDLLPVVVISGTHSARMNLLQTASGKARIFNLGRPMLRDESLVSIAMDAVRRIARATGTAVPGSAEEILRMLTAWLGWNPRALVATLCFAGGASTPKQVHVGRLWEFLQLPPGARLDRVYAVLQKVEDHLKASNWAFWLLKAGEKDREALFYHAFAHSIIGRPVARAAHIPGGNQSWADAESDGFIGLTDYKHEIQWRSGLQLAEKGDLSDPDSPPKPGKAGALGPSSPVTSAEPSAIDEDEGEAAPDFLAVACVHIPPLLLRVMYQQLSAVWSTVRSLQQFPESWEDREQSDLGLLMLRLQLGGSVFGERTMQLEELCPGLSTLGEVFIPTGDYVIHRVTQQLKAPGFAKACLEKAQVGGFWAFMGPGNWGPDSWLILIRVDGEKIILYVQSKKRIMGALQYPEAALDKEAGKCWDVPGVPSSMLYLTDERGRDEDNALIETSSGVTVVPVSRHARDVAYGVAMATIKRSREAIEQAGRGKKPKT